MATSFIVIDRIESTWTAIQTEYEIKEITTWSGILRLLFCDILQQFFDIYMNAKERYYPIQ